MARTKHVLLLLALGLVVASGTLLSSCKKKDTNETLFLIKTWKITKVVTLKTGLELSELAGAEVIFNRDGSYSHNGTSAAFLLAFPNKGSWEISDDGKKLTLNKIYVYNIVEGNIAKFELVSPNDAGFRITMK